MRQPSIDITQNILQEIAAGNATAFSELFTSHHNKLYSFVLRLSGVPQEAEDIVQDVFLKLWLKRHDLRDVKDLDSYMFRMSRNHFLNIVKRKALESAIIRDAAAPANEMSAPELYHWKEAGLQIRKAIDQLPAKQKEVFMLSRDEGLNQEQISQQLHITIPTVKSHMTQALRSLRDHCKGLYPVAKSTIAVLLSTLLG